MKMKKFTPISAYYLLFAIIWNGCMPTCGASEASVQRELISRKKEVSVEKRFQGREINGLQLGRGKKRESHSNLDMQDDGTPPEFLNCPTEEVELNAAVGKNGAYFHYSYPTAIDRWDGRIDSTPLSQNYASGSFLPIGVTDIMTIAKDKHGNFQTCAWQVKVVDLQPPIFTSCPASRRTAYEIPIGGARFDYTVAAVDNSGVPPQVHMINGSLSGNILPAGENTFSFQARDSSGNEAYCDFTVSVLDTCKEGYVGPRGSTRVCVVSLNGTVTVTCRALHLAVPDHISIEGVGPLTKEEKRQNERVKAIEQHLSIEYDNRGFDGTRGSFRKRRSLREVTLRETNEYYDGTTDSREPVTADTEEIVESYYGSIFSEVKHPENRRSNLEYPQNKVKADALQRFEDFFSGANPLADETGEKTTEGYKMQDGSLQAGLGSDAPRKPTGETLADTLVAKNDRHPLEFPSKRTQFKSDGAKFNEGSETAARETALVLRTDSGADIADERSWGPSKDLKTSSKSHHTPHGGEPSHNLSRGSRSNLPKEKKTYDTSSSVQVENNPKDKFPATKPRVPYTASSQSNPRDEQTEKRTEIHQSKTRHDYPKTSAESSEAFTGAHESNAYASFNNKGDKRESRLPENKIDSPKIEMRSPTESHFSGFPPRSETLENSAKRPSQTKKPSSFRLDDQEGASSKKSGEAHSGKSNENLSVKLKEINWRDVAWDEHIKQFVPVVLSMLDAWKDVKSAELPQRTPGSIPGYPSSGQANTYIPQMSSPLPQNPQLPFLPPGSSQLLQYPYMYPQTYRTNPSNILGAAHKTMKGLADDAHLPNMVKNGYSEYASPDSRLISLLN